MHPDNSPFAGSIAEVLADFSACHPAIKPCLERIKKAYFILKRTFAGHGKLLVCGNGGSAADAEHISGELVKGFRKKRPLNSEFLGKIKNTVGAGEWVERLQGSLPVIPLSTNTALITAISNDLGSDLVYAQQVLGYGKKGDALLAISTSGRSTNVVRAVTVAKAIGLWTIGLTGEAGGFVKELCDVTIQAPADETCRIQEYHLPIYHLLAAMLEEEFFG